jgi:hypothetical protein
MGKSKVRVRRLTLALGAQVGDAGETEADKEEDRRILDREHHCRTLVLSASLSSARRVRPHVHDVESVLRGKFWPEDSDSDTETDDDEIDRLSCSLHKMSISSLLRSEGVESRKLPRRPGSMEELHQRHGKGVARSGAQSNSAPLEPAKPRPWVGPLLQPRVSPKLTLGHAIERAKDNRSSSPPVAVSGHRDGPIEKTDHPWELRLVIESRSQEMK